MFLVRSWNTDANVVGLSDGTVVSARAMVRVAESERWNADRLLAITGTPMAVNAVTF